MEPILRQQQDETAMVLVDENGDVIVPMEEQHPLLKLL